jgi:hypothetical protein
MARIGYCKNCFKSFEQISSITQFCSSNCSIEYFNKRKPKVFCTYCKTVIENPYPGQKFCSKTCNFKNYNERLIKISNNNPASKAVMQNRRMAFCKNCSSRFDREIVKSQFCSLACKVEYNNKIIHPKKKVLKDKIEIKAVIVKPRTKVCKYCKNVIENPYHGQKFCSDKCRLFFNKKVPYGESLTRNCRHCKSDFILENIYDKFCSTSCSLAFYQQSHSHKKSWGNNIV